MHNNNTRTRIEQPPQSPITMHQCVENQDGAFQSAAGRAPTAAVRARRCRRRIDERIRGALFRVVNRAALLLVLIQMYRILIRRG